MSEPEKKIHIVFQVLNFLVSPESDNYKLLPIDKLLLIMLAKHHGYKGICPSTDTLAKELKITPTYVKERINLLDEKKVISVIRKFGSRHQYHFLIIENQSTTVDQSTTADQSTAVPTTGQPQFQNRSTTVDTINQDQFRRSIKRDSKFGKTKKKPTGEREVTSVEKQSTSFVRSEYKQTESSKKAAREALSEIKKKLPRQRKSIREIEKEELHDRA